MKITDRLYGHIQVDNPVIEQLINTTPFQRLKEINQYGGVNFVFPDKYQVSRYEHSLGVYHVLKTLGADVSTQVAGLLHDIGHTAFSHMYDMALSSHTEVNHEELMTKLSGWAEVTTILQKNSLVLGNPDEYVLIKKSLPDIGADRFDYALRDYIFATNESAESAKTCLDDLGVDGEGLCFKTVKTARLFADMANKAMKLVIYGPEVAVVYQSLIEIIRHGLKDGWLSAEDFLNTDTFVFNKMLANKTKYPQIYSKIFTHPYSVEEGTRDKCDFIHIKLKSRYFDPPVYFNGTRTRLTALDSEFKATLDDYISLFERVKTGVCYNVKFSS